MATFKETREILLVSYASNIITIEEYALLFEENSSNNLKQTFCGQKHLIGKHIRLYGSVNLFSCLCETSVLVAYIIKISNNFCGKQCVN